MKTLACIIFATLATSSCSEDIYNNKTGLTGKELDGKKMAILPPQVIYDGRNVERSPLFKREHLEAEAIQREIQNFYLTEKGRNRPWRQGVILMPNSVLAARLKLARKNIPLWELSNTQLREITGADIVLRCKLVRTRIMSKGAATAINIGSSIISGMLSKKNVEVTGPVIRGKELEYQLELIDLNSGQLLSSYYFDPNLSDAGKKLTRKANRAMVRQGVLFVREVMPEEPLKDSL
ncbi:MAG: hypothetical protein EOO88_00080 [Pedobacter sp.]|nr:MAG: hypothetical protein EOO88_00080 [Pedobacter sp.]